MGETFTLLNLLDVAYYGKNDITEKNNMKYLDMLNNLNEINSGIKIEDKSGLRIYGFIDAKENIKSLFHN